MPLRDHHRCFRTEAPEVAAEFDAIHTVERALEVGSLAEIVAPAEMRAFLIRELSADEC